MFGPFHGPFPTGKYAICAKDLGLHASSVANNMAVTMAKINQHNHLQIWVLEHGHLGYRIKNEASGNPLSYTPWAIPARLVGKNKHIIVSAESPVEWKLVQTSAADEEPRVFQSLPAEHYMRLAYYFILSPFQSALSSGWRERYLLRIPRRPNHSWDTSMLASRPRRYQMPHPQRFLPSHRSRPPPFSRRVCCRKKRHQREVPNRMHLEIK
ncbi:hypothetical protein FRB94_014435 [Tulasnella sp. JGI-2019a]|nr:hypothetical protein FRB94_014435 [Tulasnella sp. JGI-2019a]